MSLRYSASTGRLWATDDTVAGDPIVFDTDDGLLFVDPADVFVGSQAYPSRTATSSGVDGTITTVDVEQDYFLGIPSSPGARYVRGMIRTTASANGEMLDGVWRQASGTHIDAMGAVAFTPNAGMQTSNANERLATLRGFTFFVNSLGHLVMRERCIARSRDPASPPTSFNRVCAAGTVNYRLLVGSFFGADFAAKAGAQFRGWNSYASAGASYSGSLTLGYAYTGRKLAIIVHSSNADPSTVSIAGTSFTKTASIGGATFQFSVWEAVLATGTTGTISIVFPSAQGRIAVDCHAIANTTGSPTVYYAQSTTSPTSVAVSVASAQAAVAAVTQTPNFIGTTPVVDWVNAVGQYQTTTSPAFSAAVVNSGIGSANVSAGWLPTTATRAVFVAVWS